MRKLLLLSGLCLGYLMSIAQVPFVCDGDFFLSLGTNGNTTGFYRVQSNPTTGLLTFNGFSPGNNSGATVNAMGYRVTDNFIYGVDPDGSSLYRIGSDGQAFNVANLNLSTAYRYVAGDVMPDGSALIVLGSGNLGNGNVSSVLYTIDLVTGNYTAGLTFLSMIGGGVSDVFMADITIDPLTGVIFGYDGNDERLIKIDIASGIIDDQSFPAGQIADIFGALYFDAFGELHGYGRPNNGNSQNTFYDIDKNTGTMTVVATGPSANQNDGCSCPFTIEMNHWVAPNAAEPCDTVIYYVEIANNSGGDKSGLDLELQLETGLLIDQIIFNPFVGTIQSGTGTNLLSIPNVTIPVGVDTMLFTVIVEPQGGGTLTSQAVLRGLPPALGDSVLSDDPFSAPNPDSASITITPVVNDLPNQTASFCTGESVVIESSLLNSNLPITSYLWSDGSTNGTLTVTQPGMYWVITTECATWIDTIVVDILPLPNVVARPDTTVCLGESVTLSASGASTYLWGNINLNQTIGGGLNQTVSPLDTTLYRVLGTDQNGCQAADTFAVNPRPLPIVNPGPAQEICIYETVMIGDPNNVAGTYVWSSASLLSDPNLLQPLFTPSSAGLVNLTLTLTDTFGCVNSANTQVITNDFQLALSAEDIDCFGNDNGSASMTVIGSAPYSFFWTDDMGVPLGNGTQNQSPIDIANLEPGQYQGLVIDAKGCTDSLNFQINQPAAPLDISILNTQNVDCFGNLNGQIQTQANGGTMPYQYSIDGGFNYQANGSFGGLGATIYTIQTQDANGCMASISDTIVSPTGLFGNLIAKRNIDCFGNNNGQISLAGSGGAAPYSLTLDGQNYVNGLNLNNLGPGIDTVLLLDQNGCQVRIPFSIVEPPELMGDSITQQNINCFGNTTGFLSVQAAGGSGDWLYSLDGSNFGQDSFFTQLAAGSYNVIIQDDSLCQTSVAFTLTEPPLLELLNAQQKNVDCFGNNTGAVWISPQGGTLPYQLAIDTMPLGIDTLFDGLIAGNYQIRVVDDSACESIISVDISQADSLELLIAAQANVACNGNPTGFVHLEALGGSPLYLFQIDGQSFQTDSFFTQLAAGTYDFSVQDDSLCQTTISTTITEPEPLLLSLAELQQVDCFGNANGQIQAHVEGGVPLYQFQLDGGALQGDSSFMNLSPGTYLLQVVDDSSCVQTLSFDITEPSLLELSLSATDISCFGFDDGQIFSQLSGGTAGYQYVWSTVPERFTPDLDSLAGGQYQLIVEDINGCLDSAFAMINEPDSLTLAVVSNSISEAFCDWPNGVAAVVSAGGRLPHDIVWQGQNTRLGPDVDSLYGGVYNVSVSDLSGCVTTIAVPIPFTPPARPDFRSSPTYADSILLSQANVYFENLSIGGVAYHWDFGDGGFAERENPTHLYQNTGSFPVTLTAYNSYFVCPRDTTIYLEIIPDGDIFVPNAFSPNGDGHNDLFYVGGEGIRNFELLIFNRWGELLAQSNDPAFRWDGTKRQGQVVPEGVYVYRIKAVLNDGFVVDKGGTITLIR
ncbi:MAG: gliding motility-associated C-terminal domain-containing protein [Bacteroidota bacterium]